MSQLPRFCLIFGIIAAAVFIGTSIVLGALLPGYDPITQTISEIGEKGSPFEMAFKIANLFVAGSFAVFAYGVYCYYAVRQPFPVPPVFVCFHAATEFCGFIFEAPPPLHHVVWI